MPGIRSVVRLSAVIPPLTLLLGDHLFSDDGLDCAPLVRGLEWPSGWLPHHVKSQICDSPRMRNPHLCENTLKNIEPSGTSLVLDRDVRCSRFNRTDVPAATETTRRRSWGHDHDNCTWCLTSALVGRRRRTAERKAVRRWALGVHERASAPLRYCLPDAW